MKIKVLGMGCKKCNRLFAEVDNALVDSGVDAELDKVENLKEIMVYGVMAMPALVIDDEVKCAGTVPKKDEIISWISGKADE